MRNERSSGVIEKVMMIVWSSEWSPSVSDFLSKRVTWCSKITLMQWIKCYLRKRTWYQFNKESDQVQVRSQRIDFTFRALINRSEIHSCLIFPSCGNSDVIENLYNRNCEVLWSRSKRTRSNKCRKKLVESLRVKLDRHRGIAPSSLMDNGKWSRLSAKQRPVMTLVGSTARWKVRANDETVIAS